MKEMLNPKIDRNYPCWPEEAVNEPDKIQWVDEDTGLDCLAVRHERCHHWCGYVGVPKDHRFFEKEYDLVDVEVHGGLTFSDKCSEREDGLGICHVPEPGRPHEIWWLGFDCAHSGDASPGIQRHLKSIREFGKGTEYEERYRTLKYVQSECRSLAKQLL